MTVTVAATPPTVSATILHRKSVTKLEAGQLADLRRAFREVIALAPSDDRGYQYFAGWHGVPLGLCRHHEALFLPWHRQYLYYFELALQRQVPGVSLAWWDWTVDREIPPAFDEAEVEGEANPLLQAPIRVEHARPEWPTESSRAPGSFPQQPELPQPSAYQEAMEAANFNDFNSLITGVHDEVHMWVMGTMSDPSWAAYDPIFWAHHTMIDRAWALWQAAHPGANPPSNLLGTKLQPNGMTVSETLDVNQLGYDYAGTTDHVPGTNA
ncbi:MAG: tyrosinase family protein [Solirubrobacteraceae bacterium]